MNALDHFPEVDTPITTSYGKGTVQKLDIFKDRVWIQYEDGTWEDRPLEEVRGLLGRGATSREAAKRKEERDDAQTRRGKKQNNSPGSRHRRNNR